jgi:zinc protease
MIAAQYHLPAASHPDSAALAVWAHILGNEPAGRLYQQLNSPHIAANTYAWINALAERSVLFAGAHLEDKHSVVLAEAALVKAIESPGILTETHIKRAQIDTDTHFKQLLKSPEALAIALSESIGQGDWRLLFLQQEAIKRVTQADIKRVIKAYLKPDNRTLGQFIPTQKLDRAMIPAAIDIKAIADAAQYPPATQHGERFDPTPAALEARTVRSSLRSGIPLLILNKRNRADAITLRIQLRWGDKKSLQSANPYAASWVDAMLQEGSNGLSKQALTDALAQLQSTWTINSHPTGATININSDTPHVLAVLELLNTVLKRPVFEATAFERLRSSQLTMLNTQLSNPETQANDSIAHRNNLDQTLNPRDWRYRLNTAQTIDTLRALTVKDIQTSYRQFWTAAHASVSVVGTVPQGLQTALEHLLSDWSASDIAAKQAYVRQSNDYVVGHPFTQQLHIHDKANAVIASQAAFRLKRSDQDYWDLQIGANILGGDPFTSRIGKRVRVKEGLSYSAGSYIQVDPIDDSAAYLSYASFDPKNLAKVQLALSEELDNLVQKGITLQELKDSQAHLQHALDQQRASDHYLAGHLLYQSEMGLDFSLQTQHLERIQSATLDSVNTALKKYFGELSQHQIEVSAGDFTKATH